jgi:phage terminase large subunit-like protein
MQFLANLDTRLEPGATVIIVATRWHSDDLIGRVTQRMEAWEVISLPAIALEDDPIGRAPGEPLFPERYDLKRLDQIRRARAGTYLWESMYQQRPIDDTMGLTDPEWFQIVDHLSMAGEAELQKVRSWDLAATRGGGDWTVGALMGKHTPSSACFLLNLKRKQLSPADVERLVRTTAEADGRGVTILIEQEPGSSGKSLIDHYQRNVLPDFHVIGVPVGSKSKLSRAQPFLAASEHGRVRFL